MVTYKHLTYDSDKIQVDSGIRDGDGKEISTNYGLNDLSNVNVGSGNSGLFLEVDSSGGIQFVSDSGGLKMKAFTSPSTLMNYINNNHPRVIVYSNWNSASGTTKSLYGWFTYDETDGCYYGYGLYSSGSYRYVILKIDFSSYLAYYQTAYASTSLTSISCSAWSYSITALVSI